MTNTATYKSPLGTILLAANEIGLTGLWFEGQKYFARTLPKEHISKETSVLAEAKRWLDIYFAGKNRTLHRRFSLTGLHSSRLCGRSYCRFPMDRP